MYSNPTDAPIRFDIGTTTEMCLVQIDWGAAPDAVGSDLCQRSVPATGTLEPGADARDVLAARRSGFEWRGRRGTKFRGLGHPFRHDGPAPARNLEAAGPAYASAIDAASRDCALRECRLQP